MAELQVPEQPPARKRTRGSDDEEEDEARDTTPVEERAAELLESSEAEWDAATETVAKALTGL